MQANMSETSTSQEILAAIADAAAPQRELSDSEDLMLGKHRTPLQVIMGILYDKGKPTTLQELKEEVKRVMGREYDEARLLRVLATSVKEGAIVEEAERFVINPD